MARRKAPAAAAVPVPAVEPEVVVTIEVAATDDQSVLADIAKEVASVPVPPAMRAHVRREVLGPAAALDIALAEYHRQHPTWAALHVVMHDGSVDDRTVADCERTGQMLRHDVGELVRGLLALSEDERRALVARFKAA